MKSFGSLEGRHVLELGPLEGGHTSMLGAAVGQVDATEANLFAFKHCLITKEIKGLTRSKFWLGDFMKALKNWEQRYVLIAGYGVLDHLEDPLHFFELAARRSDALYIWMQLVTDQPMPSADPRRLEFAHLPETLKMAGFNDIRTSNNQSDQRFPSSREDEMTSLSALKRMRSQSRYAVQY
jgi:hypothetical protein